MGELHIYLVASNYVLAEDVPDARKVIRQLGGCAPPRCIVERWPDQEPFMVTWDDCPGWRRETLLPKEWAARYGRGLLAEYEEYEE